MVDQATELLRDLIRCPSVSPDDAGTLDILEAFLAPLGFTCTRLKFEGDNSYAVDNLFATRGAKGKHLLFGGHVDVVPPGNVDQWTHEPFSAHQEDSVIWGRGAVDMKSGVAAFCAAIVEAVADGSADKGILSLAITADEETDAINGTAKILDWAKTENKQFDFAIVGEPGSVREVGDRVKIGRRGSFDGLVTVTGTQGHVAYPDKANNPVPVIARIATALSSAMLDDGTDHFQPSNLEITTIDVGNPATNVIPETATLRFNVRYNDEWDAITLSDWIKSRIADVDAGDCTINFTQPSPASPGFICPPGAEVDLLGDVIAEATGQRPEHSTNGGTSDARFIAQYCPVVELGLVGDHMHAVDERVPIEQVTALKDIYSSFITRYFSD